MMQFKNSFWLILITSCLISLVSCGDSKINEIRGEFIEGCRNGGASRDVCSCTFEKIKDNYTKEQILDVKVGKLPPRFAEFVIDSSIQCQKED